MCRQRQVRYFVGSLVFCLSAAAASAGKTEPSENTPTSPTTVLKAVTYTGSMALQVRQRPNGEGGDRSLSPYLYVSGGDPQRDQVPLKKTWAEVSIAGVIAAVKVHQIFENSGGKPIEAVYVFPASTRAAVHAMRMKIGTRTVEAKIERKVEARQQYEAAKKAGKRASLLEQERPNVFTMNVANIMPGDRIEVTLDYSELVVPENSVYEFVYPTVVGPRYAGGADPKADQWMANPHLPAGAAEPYAWDLKVRLQTGIGLKEVASPSHKIAVNYNGPSTADIKIDQASGGNKDFVLRYRLAGDKIETGLLQYEEPGNLGRPNEKFFALMVEPPKRPALADIPGREYIFLLDVSGSMHGFPIDTTKELMRNLLPKLRPTDHFNLVFFSGANYTWSPKGSKPATEANLREGLDKIFKENGGGGTELMGGLEAAYAIPPIGKGVSRTVVVVTDGYVGVEAKAFRFIRERLDQANLFAFGIGSSVNRGLIEGMARAGLGEPFVVLGPQKAAVEAEKLREMIERPVLTDIELRFGDAGAYEVAPEKIPDLLALRPLLIYGKYKGDRPTRIEITGRTGRGVWRHAVDLRPADTRKENQALRVLWARKWVEILEDEFHLGGGKPVEDAITNLGLFYNLLTPFTSFVAIDSEVVNRGGAQDTIRQPLPMPEGVSNYAVASGQMAMPSVAGSGYGRGAGAPAPQRVRHLAAKESVADDLGGLPAEKLAPKPMVAPVSVPKAEPQRDKQSDREDRKEDGKEGGKKAKLGSKAFDKDDAKACGVTARADKAERISDTQALLTLVEGMARSHACAMPGEVKLRISVDRGGKITKVVVVSGRQEIGQTLVRKLTGATSATRASGQEATSEGTVEITLVVS